ncbi:hypothetical protein CEXT_360891 [Caerostris extrusa]|uniref:Uncharacterized protein n=1 Tax=Caerostris extrusa TaxID=172846 RepID=A0AAV4TZJ8_CAEEX|nr:hypothetical protein CEXT_360891 [Caerostris extrusa]
MPVRKIIWLTSGRAHQSPVDIETEFFGIVCPIRPPAAARNAGEFCSTSFISIVFDMHKQLRPDLFEIKFPPPTTHHCRDTRSHLVIYVAINFLGFAVDSRFRPHKTLPGLDFPLRPFLRMSERAAVHPGG